VVRNLEKVEEVADQYLKWGIIGDLTLEGSNTAKETPEIRTKEMNSLSVEGGTGGTSFERDYEFERRISETYRGLQARFQRTTQETHYCEEWFKVITGMFPNRYLEGQGNQTPAWMVMRLAQSQGGEKTAGVVQGVEGRQVERGMEGKSGEKDRQGMTVGVGGKGNGVPEGRGEKEKVNGDMAGGTISVAKTDIRISDTTTERTESSSPVESPAPIPSSQQERKDKGSKKSEDKSKEETGVENT
jgi:hypothetical protein